MGKKATPNGRCWCGCGEVVGPKRHWVSSHDRKAESELLKRFYGGLIANMIAEHGFDPTINPLRPSS